MVTGNLAKVEVEGSNPFARSKFYPKILLRDTSGTVHFAFSQKERKKWQRLSAENGNAKFHTELELDEQV